MPTLHTAAERPDLWERGIESEDVWPEYNLHGDVLNQYWGRLDQELADFQFVLYAEATDTVLAEGHTAPVFWDGDDATLPSGIDAVITAAFADGERQRANSLCALAAETPRDGRARGSAGSSGRSDAGWSGQARAVRCAAGPARCDQGLWVPSGRAG